MSGCMCPFPGLSHPMSPSASSDAGGLLTPEPAPLRGMSNDSASSSEPWDMAGPALLKKRNVWLELYGQYLHVSDSPNSKTTRIVDLGGEGVVVHETRLGFDVATTHPRSSPASLFSFARRYSGDPASPKAGANCVISLRLPGSAPRGAWLEKMSETVRVVSSRSLLNPRRSGDFSEAATESNSFVSGPSKGETCSRAPSTGFLSRLFSVQKQTSFRSSEKPGGDISSAGYRGSCLSLDSEFEAILVQGACGSVDSISNDSLASLTGASFDWNALASRDAVRELYAREFSSCDVQGVSAGEIPRPTMQDFDRLEVIGSGSFSAVFKMRHRDTGKVCAVKSIRRDLASVNEVRALLALVHPFIVPLHGIIVDDEGEGGGHVALAMPHLSGGELFKFVARNHRVWEAAGEVEAVARFFAAEIISALQFTHDRGFVYRDLKPENCVLDSAGHAVLIDFGLCKKVARGGRRHSARLSDSMRADTFCGTPAYVAPEVLQGNTEATPTLDLWSFGCVLHFLLTGQPLFQGAHPTHVYDAVLHSPIELSPAIPKQAASLMRSLLQRDPLRRMQSADDVVSHSFFAPVRWAELQARMCIPPHRALGSITAARPICKAMPSVESTGSVFEPTSLANFSFSADKGAHNLGDDEFADFSGRYLQTGMSPVL